MLEALGYGLDQNEAVKVEGTSYYDARATTATSGMGTGVAVFEQKRFVLRPSSRSSSTTKFWHVNSAHAATT